MCMALALCFADVELNGFPSVPQPLDRSLWHVPKSVNHSLVLFRSNTENKTGSGTHQPFRNQERQSTATLTKSPRCLDASGVTLIKICSTLGQTILSVFVVAAAQFFSGIELLHHLVVGTGRSQAQEMSEELAAQLGPELRALGPSGSPCWHRRLPGSKYLD